jgi:NADPH:quinone reductase-like Zn-dependent oxidoreductase
MKAIRVHEFGDPEVLRVEEVPTPQPGPVKCWFECVRDRR